MKLQRELKNSPADFFDNNYDLIVDRWLDGKSSHYIDNFDGSEGDFVDWYTDYVRERMQEFYDDYLNSF